MALRPTIHKAALSISDLDRHYYETHALTLARHPSETDERMMVRVLAFALNAQEHLVFGAGISDSDEPDLWHKDLTGAVQLWIEVGQPDPRVVRKAASRAVAVRVYVYGRGADPWWHRQRDELARFGKLSVFRIADATSAALAALAARNMQLQCLVQDGSVTVSDANTSIAVEMTQLQGMQQSP